MDARIDPKSKKGRQNNMFKVKNTCKFRPQARAEDGRPGTHGGDFGGSLLVPLVPPSTIYHQQLYRCDQYRYQQYIYQHSTKNYRYIGTDISRQTETQTNKQTHGQAYTKDKRQAGKPTECRQKCQTKMPQCTHSIVQTDGDKQRTGKQTRMPQLVSRRRAERGGGLDKLRLLDKLR